MEQILQLLQAYIQAFLNSIPPLYDQASPAISIFVFFVQWTATILYALAGAYAAREHGMDFYGALVIAFIVAVGGGTIRDLLLGRIPVFWVKNPAYVITILVVIILAALIKRGSRKSTTLAAPIDELTHAVSKSYRIIDALGLGLWAYLGTIYALQMGAPLVVAPIMAIITASFGGVLRDVFFTRVPQTFLPGQLYVTAALAGSIMYLVLWQLGVNETFGFLVCFGVTFLVRILSVTFNIQSR